MTELSRMKFDPTPRNPSLPRSASVTARLVFVQSCPECRAVAIGFAEGCIGDGSVSSLQLIVGKSHCHEVTSAEGQSEESRALIARFAARREADAQLMLGETEDPDQLPISDTNGNLDPYALPNGFDVG